MKNEPLVSVLIATYNRSHLIDQAIKSVLMQSYKNWEIIVADDASNDETQKVVAIWQKKFPRIKYARSKRNQGIAKNSNMGLKLAQGKYIAILDDDDQWADKNKLKIQVEFLEKNPQYVGCGGGIIVIDHRHKELYRYLKPETDEKIRKYMLFSNPMANTTTIFRQESGKKIGFYDVSLRYSADRDFWLKLGKIGKLYNFPRYFAYYLMSGNNTSIKKIRPHLKNSLMITKRYKDDYPNYQKAIIINYFQYYYSFMPCFLRKPLHAFLVKVKRKLFK